MGTQVHKQQFSLKTVGLFLLSGTRASCYTHALLFFFLGFLLSNTSRFLLIKSLNIGVGTIVSAHFCVAAENSKRRTLGKVSGYKPTSNSKTTNNPKKNISHSSRKIDTKGGNYVESIAGNYFDQRVTIQGYEVDVSKGISEIAEQLRQIELCLQKQGGKR